MHRKKHTVTLASDPVLIRCDDVSKWKHFPRYWPFAKGIHRSPVDSPYQGPWHGAFFFLYVPEQTVEQTIETPGDLGHHRAHYDVTAMRSLFSLNIRLGLLFQPPV